MDPIFSEEDVIFKYTRKQALEDGVLVDISEPAKEAGIKFPTAVTQAVFGVLSDTSSPGQDFKGRVWDLLMVLRMSAKSSKNDRICFAPFFTMRGSDKPEPVPMWAKCGPGDDEAPVITVMLKGED